MNLVNTGRFRGGAKLHPAASAMTVRVKNGRAEFTRATSCSWTVLTDGPFAETKEQHGGYHLIDCMDLNEAMSIAARVPTLPAGARSKCVALQSWGAELPSKLLVDLSIFRSLVAGRC